MGFMLASLAGGLASGFAAKEKEEEKLGAAFGEYAFKTLHENYKNTKKEREERESLYSDLAIKLKEYSSNYGYAPSEFEIKESISSPAFVSEFSRAMQRPDFDPSKVEWQKLFSKIDKSKASDFTGTAQDFIKGEFKMPTAQEVAAGVLPQQEQKSGLFAGVRKKSYETTFQSAAKAAGVSPEQLKGAAGIGSKSTITGSTSQFEFGAFRPEDLKTKAENLALQRVALTTTKNPPPNQKEQLDRIDWEASQLVDAMKAVDPGARSFTAVKSDALVAAAHAQQSGDPKKIKETTDKLVSIAKAEHLLANAGDKVETTEGALARLQAKAVEIKEEIKNNNGKATPEHKKMLQDIDDEITTRAEVASRYKKQAGTSEGEKERQIGLASLIANARRTVLQQYIPSENLYSLPDGSVAIKGLNKPGLEQEAFVAFQELAIKLLTKNGVPPDNTNKLLLMSSGVNFDENGRAVVNRDLTPAFRPLGGGTPTPAMPSQPSAAPTPSKTLPMPPVAAPTAPPAATPAPAGGPVTVKLPDGKTATFPNTQAAEEFKKKAGIK
jgi:hypothetical protein